MKKRQATRIVLTSVALGCLLFLATPSSAQDETPTAVMDQNRSGDLPFSSSVGTDVEHVDIGSGNLVVNIPIVHLRGRGMPFDFALRYNALFWTPGTRTPPGHPTYQFWNIEKRNYLPSVGSVLGWETNQPYTTLVKGSFYCWPDPNLTYWTGYVFHDSGGGKYPLALEVGATCDGTGDFNTANPDLAGAGIWAVLSGHFDSVYLADGTKIPYATGGADSLGNVLTLQPNYTDANGNQKSEVTGGKDTLGRVIVTTSTGTNQIFYKVYDSNGVLQTYTVNYASMSVVTGFHVTGPYGTILEGSQTVNKLTSLVLPNGKSYSFSYETGGYGALTQVTLPTGGYVTYTWATFSDKERTYRYVASRTVHVGGQSYTWNFSRQCTLLNGYCTTIQETVTDPLGNQTVYTIPCQQGVVTEVQVYQGTATGNPLRDYKVGYQGYAAVGSQLYGAMVPSRITTTLDNGLVSKKEFDYETFNFNWEDCTGGACSPPQPYTTTRGNVTEIREYDWGQGQPGPLVRKTDKTYLHNDPTVGANYLSRNIVDKVLSSTVCDGSASLCDGSGGVNQKARTVYEYDSTTITGTSGAPQHDYTNYPSTFTYRGNATKVKRWRNTDGALLTTVYNYDDLGNIRSITDPLSHTTNWSYSDSWSGSSCLPPANSLAYVTQVTNALTQRIQVVNYPCSGLVQAHKDENDIQASRAGTTYTYDLLGRVTQKNLPDGGQTSYSYNDTPPVTVTTTTKINASTNLTSIAVADGLGRVVQTQLTSDPEGAILVDTTYDALGRKATVSNPYRSTSEPTYGVTTTNYDALSRVTQVIPPDGSSSANNITTTYSGNCTTVTDQAGKQRESCTDGLGRLTQVFEDPGSLNYETDYTYDTLDNLTQVQQKGDDPNSPDWRTRTFTYIYSLSQLLTASNPESGTICYGTWQGSNCVSGYDADGNLLTKTAPAPNQTGSATVTTTYTYDALNRLRTRSYSDGTTLTANFEYDVPTWGGQNNIIGRMTEAWIGTSCCIQGSAQIFGYDAVGRTVVNNQCMPDYCPSGGAPVTYSYDLAGDMTSYTNGVGVTFGQAFDAAGRVTQITSSLSNARHPGTLVTIDPSAGYYPSGALHKLTLGNGLTQTAVYNSRLQPCRMNVNSSGSALVQCTDAIPNGNVQDFSYGFNLGTSDNGNLASLVATGTASTQTFSRVYGYDALNRLLTMTAPGDGCSGLSWTYDAWGNRTDQTHTGGTCFEFHAAADTNNRLVGSYSYDAAGNMTWDGAHHYTYDAENRIISVDGGAATYLYDALGRRTSKTVGTFTDYAYDLAGNPVAEWKNTCGGQTCWTTGYVYLSGQMVAEYRDDTTYFVLADHLGSTRVMTNVDQTILDSMDYLPYGEQIAGDTGSTHKFTGKEQDSETGLDYFGARYYSSSLGRFTIPDWAGSPTAIPYADFGNPQSLNLYAYVRNNPLAGVDADGHSCVVDGEKHNWLWCGAHKIGLAETQKEQAVEARKALAAMEGLMINGLPASLWVRDATDQQVLAAQRDLVNTLADSNNWWNWFNDSSGIPAVVGMLGANGAQFTSKTVYQGDGGHIDVENPNPGQRPGQIHYQDATGKYIYDVSTGEFRGMSKTKNAELLSRPEVRDAIRKALTYLGVQ